MQRRRRRQTSQKLGKSICFCWRQWSFSCKFPICSQGLDWENIEFKNEMATNWIEEKEYPRRLLQRQYGILKLPGASMLSPWWNPMISLIFPRHSCSMSINVGAISYVNMFVFAVAVNHSPARETMSKPVESWLKKRGWPVKSKIITILVHWWIFELGQVHTLAERLMTFPMTKFHCLDGPVCFFPFLFLFQVP